MGHENKMSSTPSRSAERTLQLFEAFAETVEPQTLSDLSRLIGVPLSTCHGLVKTLQDLGYLYSVGGTRRLYPTKKLYGLAERISRRDPVVDYFMEALTELRDAAGETVILGTRQGERVVYLDIRESDSVIRYSARAGDVKPLYSSSIGKLILGELPAKELDRLLERASLTQVTANTIVDKAALKTDIVECRAQGLYITRGENVSDVMAIAAPVRISGDLFGIALAGPLERMRAKEERLSGLLRETAAGLSTEDDGVKSR